MFYRLEVAVQVQDQVGIAGQPLQGQALGLQGGVCRVCIQATAQVLTNQGKVVVGVLGQMALHLVANAVGKVDEVAVEVFAAL
ncbi:hypothetical protein D3C79_769530 [compost metagenome]